MNALTKWFDELFSDKELDHKRAVIQRYDRMLRKELARGYGIERLLP